MKRVFIWVLFSVSLLSVNAQENYDLNPQPWNGDWLQTRLDQMVNGEFFNGWPGPLPKLWYALGLDPKHPAVDYELQERVIRDSPNWYGSCNGWAAAAIQFPEPEPMVVNGVKIFSSEARAYLAAIWKDNIEVRLGNYEEGGITAESFDQVLTDYIAQNIPLVFDVDSGVESWNYPVSGFSRTKTDNGSWTDVQVEMRYIDTVLLKSVDRLIPGSRRLLKINYTYRYNASGVYEWTGVSQNIRPQRAWFSDTPYWTIWATRGNRHLNMSVYQQLESLASGVGSFKDIYEPNESPGLAYPIYGNLIMGSLNAGDLDFFKYEKLVGEPFELAFNAYDGDPVDLEILDASGALLEVHPGVCELSIQLPDYEGAFYVKLSGLIDDETSFYELKHVGDRSYFYLAAHSPFVGGTVTAVPVRGSGAIYATNELESVALDGSTTVSGVDARQILRGDSRTVWAAEQRTEEGVQKTYALDHPLIMPYVVPQLTCRNGWKTTLHVTTTTSSPVYLEVFSEQGASIEKVRLPSSDSIDLGSILSTAASAATWFQLTSTAWNVLTGYVTFANEALGYQADFDIQSRPRNGELIVHDLPLAGEGWVGLALVNTSGVLNPIAYRLYNGDGRIVDSGSFDLQPGQKWQGLPADISSTPLGPKYSLWFFSQFNLETLALRHDAVNHADYAHRFFNPILDLHEETVVTMPHVGLDTQSFVISAIHQGTTYVTFRAFDAEGNPLFAHRLGGAPMRDFQTRYFTLAELLSEANVDLANNSISHFKITSSQSILAYELDGLPGESKRTFVNLVKIYDPH